MTQHVPEERLALYVTGDLNAGDIERIREHLQACEDCRGVAAELQQTCSMFASIADDPAQEHLAEVRSLVLRRLKHSHRAAHVWGWTAAAAAAAIALVCFAGYRTAPVPSPPVPQIAAIPPAPQTAFVGRTVSPRGAAGPAFSDADNSAQGRRGRRPQDRSPAPQRYMALVRTPAPGIESVALIAQQGRPPLIKITTTDPHVLILLASDERTKPE